MRDRPADALSAFVIVPAGRAAGTTSGALVCSSATAFEGETDPTMGHVCARCGADACSGVHDLKGAGLSSADEFPADGQIARLELIVSRRP